MAKFQVPESVQIAALQNKKAMHVATNLMAPGEGLPWEDRGSIGFFPAFFKTAFACIFRPAHTLAKIRRPDAGGDARAYAFICCGIWALAVVIHSTFNFFIYYTPLADPMNASRPIDEILTGNYVLNTIVQAAGAGVWALLLWQLSSRLFYRMIAFDMTSKANPLLMTSLMAYMMSPSLIALIPGGHSYTTWVLPYAPIVAVLWIAGLWIVVGIRRLNLKVAATLIATIITFLVCAVLVLGVILLGLLVFMKLMDAGSLPAHDANMFKN